MILIIGGCYQGKCDYALEQYHLSRKDVFTCSDDSIIIDMDKPIIEHIERFAYACVQRGIEPADEWKKRLPENADAILISDDISCGVVPIDPMLRSWREATGRANNALAKQAEHVIRVFCGLGQVIK